MSKGSKKEKYSSPSTTDFSKINPAFDEEEENEAGALYDMGKNNEEDGGQGGGAANNEAGALYDMGRADEGNMVASKPAARKASAKPKSAPRDDAGALYDMGKADEDGGGARPLSMKKEEFGFEAEEVSPEGESLYFNNTPGADLSLED